MDVNDDERLVEDWLTKKGLRVERFSKAEMRCSKTPEFRVFRGSKLAFFCEVKSMAKDKRLDEAIAAVPPGTVAEVGGPDPTFNSIENKIHEAVGQFDAVNSDLAQANVLVLVNDDPDRDVSDLRAVVTGDFVTDNGRKYPFYRVYSEGRIKQEKLRITVYVWMERQTRRTFIAGRWHDCLLDRYPVLAEILPSMGEGCLT